MKKTPPPSNDPLQPSKGSLRQRKYASAGTVINARLTDPEALRVLEKERKKGSTVAQVIESGLRALKQVKKTS